MIDSVSVYESALVNSDMELKIEITPSSAASGNKYGSITYTYEYKFNDTEWTELKTTSDTSCSLPITLDKETVQVRVKAQDDIGFVSDTYVTSDVIPIYASNPPTAPASIEVDRAVAGWDTTVTISPATDPDGTIVSYIFERKTDSQDWSEVQNGSELTYSETIQDGWKTVQYRARAVDDSGTKGPYIESDIYDVKSNVIVIIGPRKPDFGSKIGVFLITFYVIVAGSKQTTDISVNATLDTDSVLYSGLVAPEQKVSFEIDTSKLERTTHTVTITASKEGYEMASNTYTFVIKDLVLPEGGYVVQFQDSKGQPVSPMSKAQGIIMNDGRNLETVIADILSKIQG